MNAYSRARKLIDAAHAQDPNCSSSGIPAELLYADRMEAWVGRLLPEASSLLLLAARCQHLERWKTPRSSYPEGKAGYLAWRRFLYTQQADRTRELLSQGELAANEIEEACLWVSKTDLKSNPGTQALEDAAILVFLENEIGSFIAQHGDYPREKLIDILRKSWRKLSPQGQAAASRLELPPEIAGLVQEAVQAVQ